MKNKEIKIIIFITVVLIMITASPAKSDTNEPNNIQPFSEKFKSIYNSDPNSILTTKEDDYSIYFRLMAAVGIVLVLGAVSIYVSKKFSTKIVRSQAGQMQIDETLYLGSKKALHLVRIGNERILIATTPTTVTKIEKLENQKANPENRDN